MLSAAMVLATAVFSSSATAASLDVEPREPTTAPVVQDTNINNSSANATNDGKIGIQKACRAMKYANWDNVKYACHWDHTVFVIDAQYNHFFKYYDGSVVMECDCDWGLSVYDPWGARWTPSSYKHVMCFTRDGRVAYDVKSEFDAYKC